MLKSDGEFQSYP